MHEHRIKHSYGKMHCTRDDLCRKGLILNRPPIFAHLSNDEQPLSSAELYRRGFHAAGDARRATEDAWIGLDGYRLKIGPARGFPHTRRADP